MLLYIISIGCSLVFAITEGSFLGLNCTNYLFDMVNRTCEICGSVAHNVAGAFEVETTEQWNEANDASTAAAPTGFASPSETRNFWQGHRFLNFLLACMVFAFVISWLFHFNVPS